MEQTYVTSCGVHLLVLWVWECLA